MDSCRSVVAWRSVRYPFEWWKKNHRSTDAYRTRIGQTVGRPNLVPGRSYARTSGSLLSLTFESPPFEWRGSEGRPILVCPRQHPDLFLPFEALLGERGEANERTWSHSLILVRVGCQRILPLL